MTIIVFLVDTSASMEQKAYVSGRCSILDVAKGAVEFFVKMRQKSSESRGDRYMLLTFEDYPKNIKAGWKENLQTFMSELKNLVASGMTSMGSALKQVFDILNMNRMQTGIDMYGQGRYPFYLEPAVIIVISDGGRLTTQGSVQSELNLPMHSTVPGSELTREPFRWDQRLYALVLRMGGTPPTSQDGHVATDNSPIDAMCEVTGGRSYMVTSQRVLHQCIDSLVQKLQFGVVVHFEKIGPDPPPINEEEEIQVEQQQQQLQQQQSMPDWDEEEDLIHNKGLVFSKETGSRPHTPNPILSPSNVSWHNCRRLIYVPRSAQKGFTLGFWPLPESFLPENNSPALVKRSAHPNVKFTCTNVEPMIIDNLPFDKYELEPSPLTLYILARKQPKVSWQVYIQGSIKGGGLTDKGHPFGYLKASSNLLTVNLFVLPYNYPMLLPLLDELFRQHRLKPTNEWKAAFSNYLKTMPPYYAGPLRKALTRMGAGNLAMTLIPDTLDNCLSFTVSTYLKRLKNQAKQEYEKTLSTTPVLRSRIESIKVQPRSPFKKDHLLLNSKANTNGFREQLNDFPGFALQVKDGTMSNKSSSSSNPYRNPFDIPRHDLLDQIVRMKANFLQPSAKLINEDSKHSLPIGQMGNYQDYLKRMPTPLKEIENTPVRQHMFGNPFKINKNIMLDEVVDEIALSGGGQSQQPISSGGGGAAAAGANQGSAPNGVPVNTPNGRKRFLDPSGSYHPLPKKLKKGPLPRDFIYRSRSESPPIGQEYQNVYLESPPLVIHEPEPSPAEESPLIDPPQLSIPESDSSLSSLMFINGLCPDVSPDEEPELSTLVETAPKEEEQQQQPTPKKKEEEPPVKVEEEPPTAGSSPASSSNNDSPEPLNKEELRSIKLRNQNIRQMICKEVKRPGKNHERLFRMLKEDLTGPSQIRRDYINEVIQEAVRFKRKSLAESLLLKMNELVKV